jgi:hypothetical protein
MGDVSFFDQTRGWRLLTCYYKSSAAPSELDRFFPIPGVPPGCRRTPPQAILSPRLRRSRTEASGKSLPYNQVQWTYFTLQVAVEKLLTLSRSVPRNLQNLERLTAHSYLLVTCTLVLIRRCSRNLRQAKCTERSAQLETGASGISRIRAFWRARMASVAFMESNPFGRVFEENRSR